MRGFGGIKSVMGVTGSTRPCNGLTCGGEMAAFLYKYDDGKFRLIWRCDRCHMESEAGKAEAITLEPRDSLEALS